VFGRLRVGDDVALFEVLMKPQPTSKSGGREPRPPREDWRICRAQYLKDAGRLDQLKAEGLEHFLHARAKGAHA
jgi:hypothetical protein